MLVWKQTQYLYLNIDTCDILGRPLSEEACEMQEPSTQSVAHFLP